MNHLAVVFLSLFLLWSGSALANDVGQKLVLFESAVEGNATAQYELALIYEEEAIAAGDYFDPAPGAWKKAIRWYEAAAAQGNSEARNALLRYVYSPESSPDEELKWIILATELAENGHKYAKYMLAEFYYFKCVGGRKYDGDPFPPAIRWYSELLEGNCSDETEIFSKATTFTSEVTVVDIKQKLNYLKELSQ